MASVFMVLDADHSCEALPSCPLAQAESAGEPEVVFIIFWSLSGRAANSSSFALITYFRP